MISFKTTYILLLLSFALTFPLSAHAAVLSLSPESESTGVGGEVVVDVVIDSEGERVNASEAVIHFPTNILEVSEIDDSESIFNFWVEEPTFSNDEGVITFTGGTPDSASGDELHVARIVFTARGAGNAELTLSDAVVTAADGRGTNVLRTVQGAAIGIETEAIQPEPQEQQEEPEVVTRTPAQASSLPEAPDVRVPLYADSEAWHNHTGETTILWNVPDDVTAVAFVLNQSPNTTPFSPEEELVTGRKVGVLEEGVWYAHVRFRNAIGWGEVTHYRIAIDTTNPLSLELSLPDDASENPSPEINFEAQDALSGFSHARIVVDNQEPVTATTSPVMLPPQGPGSHTVTVRVFDEAGNSVEQMASFEVLPIEKPTIDFVSGTVEQGQAVFVSGSSLPNVTVEVLVRNENGGEVWSGTTQSNDSGSWKLSIEEVFPRGDYTVVVNARDEREARSLLTEPVAFSVRAQTVFAVGGIAVGWFEILAFVVLFVIGAIGYGAWWYARTQETRSAYHTVVGRDIDKMANLMQEQIDLLARWQEQEANNLTPQAREEAAHALNKLRTLVSKTKRYIKQEINPLK